MLSLRRRFATLPSSTSRTLPTWRGHTQFWDIGTVHFLRLFPQRRLASLANSHCRPWLTWCGARWRQRPWGKLLAGAPSQLYRQCSWTRVQRQPPAMKATAQPRRAASHPPRRSSVWPRPSPRRELWRMRSTPRRPTPSRGVAQPWTPPRSPAPHRRGAHGRTRADRMCCRSNQIFASCGSRQGGRSALTRRRTLGAAPA
mmetsp:Transcript_20299/g.44193  ORF Transcript_20299/g.44193 Transcript_20299/m.44193 type:complete len:200 (-) Transcript_20299:552-1151(-)